MRKFLIISLVIFLLTTITFFGCINKTLENEEPALESLESTIETSTQSDNRSAETAGEKIPLVMSITPEEAYRIISEVKDHFLLDVRTIEEYNLSHIEGANLIPVSELENRLDEIPKDKRVIVYCKSGFRSRTAANILMKNEFGMVYDMGGIDDWQSKGYPVVVGKETAAEFEEITVDEAYQIFISNKDYFFIDVRSEDEYASGHIEDAVHIPVSEIESRLDEIPIDKTVIVYCNGSSCSRSRTAADILIENDFKVVYSIGGEGIFEWIEKGYPVTELK